MPVAIECIYRPGGAEERFTIRDVHLEYVIANRHKILAGGPLHIGETTAGMYLLLTTGDLEEAQAFSAIEPYTKAGLFVEVRFTVVEGFIPEPREGFLQDLLVAARLLSARLRTTTYAHQPE